MKYPPFLELNSKGNYRKHYERKYCQKPITTFDNIPVYFKKTRFNGAFFESSRKDSAKDFYSFERAKRMDWIDVALKDKSVERYLGWDKRKKCYDKSRRLTIVMFDYVVIIRFNLSFTKAFFVTAFVVEKDTLNKIRNCPLWK